MNDEDDIEEEIYLEDLEQEYGIVYDDPYHEKEEHSDVSEVEGIRPLDEVSLKWLCENHEIIREHSKIRKDDSHIKRIYEFERRKREVVKHNRSVSNDKQKALPIRSECIEREKKDV